MNPSSVGYFVALEGHPALGGGQGQPVRLLCVLTRT